MDYIMKLLEEDEAAGLAATYSEGDVDVFTAELSRCVDGHSSASQPVRSNMVMSRGLSNSQFYHQRQNLSPNRNLSMPSATAPQYWQTYVSAHPLGQNTYVDPSQKIPSALQYFGNNASASVHRPIIAQKKLPETSSLPSSSKKQKVSGSSMDHIEQLNDVTAISGINLGHEEEHLFSGSKKFSRVSEAPRRVVQEEEKMFILCRASLQKKLEGIMLKCGVTSKSNDVEQCLSMCVEERMRQLIRNLIRLSKQRIDISKPKDRSFVTSDIRQEILLVNQKTKDEWEKKHAAIGRMQKLNEIESNSSSAGRDEKRESHLIAYKPNKEIIKMRATAANAAARASVGGMDMQSKWQLMAEQARQKHVDSSAALSSSRPSVSGRSLNKSRDTKSSSAGFAIKPGKTRRAVTPTKLGRTISVKDVIAVLEREPQMSKSRLLYGLYNKAIKADSSAEQPEAL